MKKFLEAAANQNHPLRILKDFLVREEALEKSKQYSQLRFVGYVLDIGYGEVRIITSDPFKVAVGGIPRNSLLIMCPSSFEEDGLSIPPHFTLLRVLDTAPTPLSSEVQQTYFELQKKSMPELDIFTQSELQWGALKTSVLGMFYPHPEKADTNALDKIIDVDRETKLPSSTKGKNLFDEDDVALFDFLKPRGTASAGPGMLQTYRKYHDEHAGNFITEILAELDKGQTMILDLGNANEEVMQYFSRELSNAVFRHQTKKFTENKLGNHFIQLYFEEAHNLFKDNDNSDETKIYRRFAKEGAKYHIGMVYSTQSPTTINADLLAQTENFFIAHLSSQDDVNKLAKLNVAYESLKNDILQAFERKARIF